MEVVTYEGIVYSVKGFKTEHPGGKRVIEAELGTNIEEVFNDVPHSSNAKKLLKTLPVVGRLKQVKNDVADEKLDDKYIEDEIDIEENKLLKAFCCSKR
jgi:cytochrome b involved in lipid metabolism